MRTIFFIMFVLLFACKDKEDNKENERKIFALKYIIEEQLHENSIILNYIINQVYQDQRIPINLIVELNGLARRQIDKEFYVDDPYTKPMDLSDLEIKNRYKKLYDSLLIADHAIKYYINQDSTFQHIQYPAGNNELSDRFSKSLLVIIKQNELLRKIRSAHSPSRCGFDGISSIGREFTIQEVDQFHLIKIHFTTSNWMKCIPKRLVRLYSSENDKGSLMLKSTRIEQDNLIMVTKKLEKGTYYAEIDYKMLFEEGHDSESTYTFSFSVD
ncbi:MAG: hypothetical protein V4677_07855 [Bacteroidota bacterium]